VVLTGLSCPSLPAFLGNPELTVAVLILNVNALVSITEECRSTCVLTVGAECGPLPEKVPAEIQSRHFYSAPLTVIAL